jgi:hypothetical protein
VLHSGRLERHARDKYSSLLQKYVKYGQKSFIILAPGAIFATLHFIVIHAQQARELQYTKLERLAGDKHSIVLGPFVSYKEIQPFVFIQNTSFSS